MGEKKHSEIREEGGGGREPRRRKGEPARWKDFRPENLAGLAQDPAKVHRAQEKPRIQVCS